jgi:hypothetical protein
MSVRLTNALNEVKTLPVITLGTIVEKIGEEALLILTLIAILPFMQPIPIPGLSSVLGLIVVLQGIGLVFTGKPVLTRRLKQVIIPHEKFEVLQRAAGKFMYYMSKLSLMQHPLANSRASQIISGVSIILSAAFLSLPLPIPFSNFIPALSIFFICLGLLEEDLLLLICGHGIAAGVVWMAIFSYQLILAQFHAWF